MEECTENRIYVVLISQNHVHIIHKHYVLEVHMYVLVISPYGLAYYVKGPACSGEC